MKNLEQSKECVELFKDAIVRMPKDKVLNINTDASKRDSEFCVFILSYGRADKTTTYNTLIEYPGASLNQDMYFICSDDDKQLDKYIEKFGDKVLVFNKEKMIDNVDTGDNFRRMNIVVYARNICFTFAKELGYKYFLVLDDDYDRFGQRIFYDMEKLPQKDIYDYDKLFKIHLDFLKTTNARTISMSQNGDYMGGAGNGNARRGFQRKVMNSFFCAVDRPYMFDGTINEDVNYYVQAGRLGILNFNLFGFTLNQGQTQANAGGLTEIYLQEGTYVKSFYSVIFCPSSVKVGKLSSGAGERLHHKVNSNTTYVQILDEKYSKQTYSEIHNEDW
jgi:hypothetical protein